MVITAEVITGSRKRGDFNSICKHTQKRISRYFDLCTKMIQLPMRFKRSSPGGKRSVVFK